MKRSDFLRKIGLGALVAAVAPKAIAWKEPKVIAGADPAMPGGNIQFAIDASFIPNNMTLEEFISECHKNSGTILYTPEKIHAAKPYKPGIIRDQGLVH